MQIACNLNLAEKAAGEAYGSQKKVVALMLANYDAKLVKDVVARCCSAWDYEAGADVAMYWLGYSHYIFGSEETGKRSNTTFIANFNPEADTQKTYCLADYKSNKERDTLLKRLKNPTGVTFERRAYLDGKREIRERMQVSKEQKIDSFTLFIVEYYNGSFHFEDGKYLAVNLHELKNAPDPVTDINDLISSVIFHCRAESDFERLLKKIKKERPKDKKEPDITGWVGIGVSVLASILSLLAK